MTTDEDPKTWDGQTDTLRGWATAEKANGRLAVSQLLRDAAREIDALRRSLWLRGREEPK